MGSDSTSGTGSSLLTLLRGPSPQAWNAFVDRYGPKVHGWCRQRGLQEADAENVTQDVLTLLVTKLREFRYDPDKGTFRGWLRTVTRHAWSDYLARQRPALVGSGSPEVVEQLHSLEAREDLLVSLADAFDLDLLAEAQARVQLRVKPRDWKIFHDLAVERRPARAVAEELGMRPSAVLTVRSRVQEQLRREVQRMEGDNSGLEEGGP
jgi:RNA polymerase sigma-70 factor (ECF subfamily)